MSSIHIQNLTFNPYIKANEIIQIIERLAMEINLFYKDSDDVIAIVVLKGGYVFASDLLRKVTKDLPVYFIQLSSYINTKSSGEVKVSDLNFPILDGKKILIIEDIIESGLSMQKLLVQEVFNNVKSVDLCTLLLKPSELKVDLDIRFVGLEIPPAFVVGYGLDYNEYGRHLQDIYQLKA